MIKLGESGLKLNFATANILIVEDKVSEQDILAQILMGFGVPGIQRRATADEAMRAMSTETFDLALIDASLKETDGYQLIKNMRRHGQESVKHMPIFLLCGHVRMPDVIQARDCGANFVLTKPISPQVLFDRIVWLARARRVFVESDTYVGPDRRFKSFGPPVGMPGRRHDDLSAQVGEPSGANLSQDAIDGFFNPSKVSL
jgi:DNA-binding response OmpR family regulator